MTHRRVRGQHHTIPLVTLLTLLVTCTEDRSPLGPRVWVTPMGQVTANPPEVLIGAGDIAECAETHDEETASLLDGIAGTVFTTGDNAYEDGSTADYQNCYDPSWGRHKARTRPVPGNHEYNTPDATGYFDYFGAAAGEAGKGYYSYDLGDWHVVALNNYISMELGSEQDNWLRADLAATTQPCKLAYYHEPLYSSTTGSGSGGVTVAGVRPLFTTLYTGGVDVVLNGHRHFYERLAPSNPDGQLDAENGIRTFIVGTGGSAIGDPTNAFPLSEVRFGSNNYGVLKLYLYSDSYAWKFIPVPGQTLSDTGSYACHGAAPGVSPTQSTVTAAPTAITVDGQTSTIEVTARNAFGNPVSGAAVVLQATGTGNTLTPSTGSTDANGVFRATLSSTDLGQKTVSATADGTAINQTATVTVELPTVFAHTLLTAGNNTVNQTVYSTAPIAPAPNTLITVAVLSHRSFGASPSPTLSGGGMTFWTEVASTTFDPLSAPTRRLTIYRALSAAPGNGSLTITFSGNQSNCQWIVSQWGGVDLSGVNGAGAIVQSGSTRADGVNGLTVPLAGFGSANNVAYGAFGVRSNQAVITPGTFFTEISEQPSGESTPGDLQAEWRTSDNTIDATWAQSLNAGALGVEIKAAASGSGSGVDALQSTVSAAPASITAGGAGSAITVTVRNATGSPISGATVSLASSGTGNTFTPPSGPTNASGVFTATLTSTVAETKSVHATANGTPITETAAVTVTPGPISGTQSTVTASPTSISPGGQTATITVTVTDAFGNPVSGAAVVLTATGVGNTLTQPSPTDASGLATGALSSTVAETKTVSATANGTPLPQTTVTVTTQIPGSISHTLLTAGTNTVNQAVYTTAPIAPAPNTLITVAVLGHRSSGASARPALSGGGMTAWTEVVTTSFDAVSAPLRRLTIYRAMSASPGSGPITITFTGNQSNCQWIVSQWGGVDESGVNGAGAIVQTGSTGGDAVTGLTVALAGLGSANNVAYGAFGVRSNQAAITSGAGFTEIAEQPSGENTPGDLQTEWATNDPTIDATWTQNLNSGALGVEIKAAASGASSVVDAGLSTVDASPTSITHGGAGSTITVTVRDASGGPLSGATVELHATGSGNTLTPPGPTDANGVHEGVLTSTVPEQKVVTATATIGFVTTAITQTATVTVTGGGGTSGSIAINAGAGQSATVGTAVAIAPSVIVRDEFNNPAVGVPVTFAAASGGGTVVPTTAVTTDANGIAAVTSWTLGTTTGTNTLTATSSGVGGSPVTFTATGTADAASTIAINAGNGQSAAVGTAVSIPPSVRVADQFGNAVAGVSVTFAVASGGGTVDPTTAVTTNASGIAAATSWTLGPSAGSNTLTATASGLAGSPVTFTATGTVGSASTIALNAGDGQSATVGTAVAIPPSVIVRDQFNNPVAGVPVTFAVASGGGTVNPTTAVTTNAAGVAAATSWALGATAGTNTLTATSSGLAGSPVTFTATAISTGSIAINAGDAQNAAVGTAVAVPPSVIVRDGFDQPAAGVPVSFAVASGGGAVEPTTAVTTDANGIAAVTSWTLGTTAGANALTAASDGRSGSPVTFTATGTAGAASTMTINSGDGQSATVGTAVAIAPSVIVRDQFNNPVAGVPVMFAVASGGGTVNPTTAVTTNAAGVAAATSWTLGVTAGANTLTVTSDGLTPITFTATATEQTVSITQTLLTVGTNTANQRIYPTAAIAPAANQLVTVAVLGYSSLGTPPIPTLSGGGMTAWDVVASVSFDTGTLPLRRLTIFRAMSAAPGSGPLTITSGMTLSHAQWIVSQWDGVETGGVNGSGAVVQTGSTQGDAVNGLAVSLAAFGNGNNVAYGAFGVRSTVAAVTPGAGFAEIAEQPSGEGTPGDLQAEWATNVSTISATWANLNGGALGVEIKAR